MQCSNDDRIPNPRDYSHFGNEDSTMTASKYNADIYYDYHYKDFSNDSESLNYHAPCDRLLTLSTDVTPQKDLPTPTRNPRNIWVKKVKLPAQTVHCDVCDCNLNSSAQAEAHFKGQSHQKRLMNKVRLADPACPNFMNDTDTRTIVAEGYSSFESGETLGSTDKQTTGEVSEKHEQQGTGVSPPGASCPQDSDEFRVIEPPKKKQRVILAIPCEICGLTFNSEAQAGDHFKSSKHIKKIQLLQQISIEDTSPLIQVSLPRPNPPGKCRFHCGVCNVSLNSSAQFDQHCSGQGHKKKLLNFSAPENETSGHKSGWFYCRICDTSCRTALGLHKHVSTEDHKTKTQAKTEWTEADLPGLHVSSEDRETRSTTEGDPSGS